MRPGKTQHRLLTLLLLLGLAIGVSAAESVPSLPQEFWGALTIDGSPAPAGTEIVAAINGTTSGSVTTTVAGAYGGSAALEGNHLLVSGVDGQEGQTIAFLVDGTAADQTVTFTPGTAMQLDLTVRTTPVPVANFTATPTSGDAPLAVNFTDLSTDSPTAWAWDFENDGVVDSTEQSPSFTYTAAGTYTVNLTVSNDAGSNSAVKTDYITVSSGGSGGDAPVADFTASATSGSVPLFVRFTDTSTNSPTSWAWDFGDGSNSTEQNVTHTYMAAGTYTVTLTATNSAGSDGETRTDLITVVAGSVNGGLADTAWPVYMHDINHTGQSPYNGPQTNTVQWTYTTGGRIMYSSPVIGTDGTLYFGSYDKNFYALNPNGTVKWTYPTGGSLQGAAAIGADGTIYVGNYGEKKIYALNPDGSEKWNYTTGGTIRSLTIGHDGTIYHGNNDKNIYALNPDGTLKWATLTTGSFFATPAIGSDGTIYIGSKVGDSRFYALNPDGSLKWTYAAGGPISDPAIGSDGTIYFGTTGGDNKLYAMNTDGTLKWSYQVSESIYGTPAIGTDGTLYFGDNGASSHMYALNSNGTLKWSVNNGRMYGSAVIGSDGTIYFASYGDKTIYALNPNGTVIWSYLTGAAEYGSPSIGADGTLYFGSYNGNLYAFHDASPVANFTANVTAGEAPLNVQFTDASNGSPTAWAWDFGDGSASTEQNATHTYMAAGTYTVTLNATNSAGSDTETKAGYITVSESSGGSGLADSAWPKFGGNEQNTGRSNYIGSQTNETKWIFATGTSISDSSAVIGPDGTIYLGTPNTFLFAINSDGTQKWSYALRDYGSPTIGADGTIYVASYDKNVYAFDPNGTVKWKYTTGGVMYCSPAIGTDGTLYVGNYGDKNVYALNPNGTLKWKYTTTGAIADSAAIGTDGTVYFGSYGDNKVYALNPDGTLKWTYTAGGKFYYGSPVVGADGTIYLGDYGDSKIYALNPDGTLKWAYTTGNKIYQSPAICTDGTIVIGSSDGTLYALNTDGSLKWMYSTTGSFRGSPAIGADGTIYIGNYGDKNIYALNPDGTLKWTYTADKGVIAPPSIGSDGTVYVGSNDGNLYAFAGVVNITATPTSGTSVQFNATSPLTVTAWTWDFGDGSTSTEQNPLHTYTAAGNYTVNLTITHANGTNYLVQTVTVAAPAVSPIANFTATPTSGEAPLSVNFTDISANSPVSWSWDFENDGVIDSTEQNPSFTYTAAGTYTVNLTVSNAAGSDSAVRTDYITVTSGGSGGDAPVASFTADRRAGIAPASVTFTDTSLNTPTSWSWDFGDGSNSTEQNPTHTYTAAGNYTVNLTVTNGAGSDTFTGTTYIAVLASEAALSNYHFINVYVANDDGVKYDVPDGAAASGGTYAYVNNTYWVMFRQAGGGLNPIHLSASDNSFTAQDITSTTNQSGSFWVTFSGGQPSMPDAILLLAINGTIPDDFKVHIRSSGNDFDVGTPGTSNQGLPAESTHLDGAVNETFDKNDFIYGPQSWRPCSSEGYPIFSGEDQTDPANQYHLMFVDLKVGALQNSSLPDNGMIKVEYAFTNLSSTAVFNVYGWYMQCNHGTGIIMTNNVDTSGYTVVGDGGSSGPETPVANFTATPTSGDAPLSVNFTDLSTGSPTSWAWDFENDGTVDSTEQNPSFIYTTAGTYTVNLTVTNGAGSDAGVKTDYITVTGGSGGDAPVANFTATPLSGEAPLTVQFTDLSTGTPISWAWDFENDGVVDSTEQSPQNTYTTTGTYSVNLTVANAAGTDSIVRTGYIRAEDARVLTSIALSPAGAELRVGARQKFAANPLDQQGRVMSGINLAWVSENESVGTIDGAGMFTALAPGETVITVSNGSVRNASNVLVIAASGEQNQPSAIDIPGCNITGNPNGTTTVSVNTSAADVAVGGNEIVIREETFNMTITTEGSPEVNNGTVNGTVAGIRIDTVPVVTDLGEAGTVSAAVGANLTNIPSGAGLNVTISDNVSTGARSAFELAASQDGLTVDAVAYVMNIDRTNLDNGADIADATIRMSVSSAWVAAHGGNTSIQIIRWAEDGTKEVLETRSLGFDGDMEIFEAFSPNGLSLFGLATTTAQPASPSTVSGTSSSTGGGRSAVGVGAAENIRAGETATLTFSEAPVTEIEVHAQEDIPNILITTEAGTKPGDAGDPDGDVYEYISIACYKAPEGSLKWATIRFIVPTNWVDERLSSPDLLSLYRYDEETGEWTLLSTVLAGEENGGYAYYADSASFGYFAVVVQPDVKEVAVSPATSPEETPGSQDAEQKVASAEPTTTATATPLFGGGMIVCVAVALFCVLALLNRRLR